MYQNEEFSAWIMKICLAVQRIFDGKSGIKFHKNNKLQQGKSGGVSFGTNIWNRYHSGSVRTDSAYWNFEEKCRAFAEFCGADGGVSDLYVLLKFLFYIQGI